MSSSSHSSLPYSVSSSPQSVDQLTADLISLKQQITALGARYTSLLDQLTAHVRDGQTPVSSGEPFTAHGHTFTQATRRTYTLPKDHPITLREKELKAEREIAIALGEATEKITTYWTIRQLKDQ